MIPIKENAMAKAIDLLVKLIELKRDAKQIP
jgi:hypothetical protein